MINSILAASTKGAPEPAPGMGGTVLLWSDRHAVTIIATTRFKTGQRQGQVKTVTVQRDIARRTDSRGMSDVQNWEFDRDFDGSVSTFTVNKAGRFVNKAGFTLAVGYRSEYYDFSL